MRIFRRSVLLALCLAAIVSVSLEAQAGPGAGGGAPGPQRALLERRFRERSAELVRRQLQLNDDQMARLQATNQQFDRQRAALITEERQTRQSLRSELSRTDSANQQRVASLLDQMLRLERQRLDLVASEQRELGKFLTPVQRAKYLGLQNQLRQRMQELRDGGGPGAGRRTPLMRPPGGRRNPR